jgi:hypothetical protein
VSGQAKRSRGYAAVRHREQVARMIGQALYGSQPCLPCNGSGVFGSNTDNPRPCDGCGGTRLRANHAARQYLDGSVMFDVHAARTYVERLLAEGEQACATWDVFIDWCRDQGLGPESMAGTTKRGRDESTFSPGGWPFGLAAAWARGPGRVVCKRCEGRGSVTAPYKVGYYGPDIIDCPKCESTGLVAGPRPQPGDAQGRMGRLLLAALDGQPSECQACKGLPTVTPEGHTYLRQGTPNTSGVYYVHSMRCPCGLSESETMVVQGDCASCHGTAHNLGGVLPEIEWPAAVRRKIVDGWDAIRGTAREVAEWPHAFDEGVDYPDDAVRSVPRGLQRALESADMVAASNRCTRNVSVNDGESLSLWAPVSVLWAATAPEMHRRPGHSYEQRLDRCPRWWRGEHARRLAGWTIAYEPLVTPAQGADLDQVAAGIQLARGLGETDAELRDRITEVIRGRVADSLDPIVGQPFTPATLDVASAILRDGLAGYLTPATPGE